MSTEQECPNCGEPKWPHPDSGCVLAALITVIDERGGTSQKRLKHLLYNANIDALWDRLGPVIDDLERGLYSDGD